MFGFGFLEFIVIAFIVLLLLGPKDFISVMERLASFVSRVKYEFHLLQEYYLSKKDKTIEPNEEKDIHLSVIEKKKHHLKLALYQPEIPQNTGTIIRTASCLGVDIDIIEPCGFVWNNKKMKRSGMDYIYDVSIKKHDSWEVFFKCYENARIILIDTYGSHDYINFSFMPYDILLLGRESDGVPQYVLDQCTETIRISMQPNKRSLNVAMAGGIVLAEALRQLR